MNHTAIALISFAFDWSYARRQLRASQKLDQRLPAESNEA